MKTSPVRVLLPALLILVWLGALGAGGPFFGKLGEVVSNDQVTFLPESAESTQVSQRAADFASEDAIPAIAVVERPEGITAQDRAWAQEVADTAQDRGLAVAQGSPPIPSEDGRALQLIVLMDPADPGPQVSGLRQEMAATAPDGLSTHVTGPAGFVTELAEGFAGIDGILLIVALAVVLVILVIVYRSPLLPLVVLIASMAALCAAIVVVYLLARADLIQINGQVQGILFILVVGAATDYSLLYTARYREALRTAADRWQATRQAVRGTLEPVLASGGTVIAGLLCLLLSDIGSTRALGPAAATGILFSMLAALTFLPAVLALLGRAAFWPAMPRRSHRPAPWAQAAQDVPEGHGIWSRIGRFVERRQRPIWILALVALIAMAAFAPQLRATGLKQTEVLVGASPAADGQEVLSRHFPGGSGTPITVIAPEGREADVARAAERIDVVDSVTVTSADSPSGTLPVTPDGIPQGPPPGAGPPPGVGGPGGSPFAGAEPTVADGSIQLQLTTSTDPDDDRTVQAVQDLRAQLHEQGDGFLVGGETATTLDTNATSTADRQLIIPVIVVVVTLILMALLRSVLAPVLLMALTVLSFLSALGVSALVFNHLLGFPNSDPSVPLYAFVFLVALGIDYNIFLMSRVREESLVHGTRAGVLRGLVVTGGVITSAGVVLASTFAALAVIPIVFMVQLAFIVAFGVLLDTLLVRTLLVPALVRDIGRAVWWPGQRRIAP